MALRSLGIDIGFKINSGPLKQADDATDGIKKAAKDATKGFDDIGFKAFDAGKQVGNSAMDAGEKLDEMGFKAEQAGEKIGGSANQAEKDIRDLGNQSDQESRKMQTGFRGVSDELENVGNQASKAFKLISAGIGTLAGGKMIGGLFNAAANDELLGIQLRSVAETEEQWNALGNTVDGLVKKTRGAFRESDILGIAQRMEAAGMSFDTFMNTAESAIVSSIGAGRDFEQVMMRINRAITLGLGTSEEFALQTGINLRQAILDAGHSLDDWKNKWDATRREVFVTDLLLSESIKRQNAFDQALETGAFASKAFRGALNDLGSTMGNTFLKPGTKALQMLTNMFDAINSNPVGQFILQVISWGLVLGTLSTGVFTIVKGISMLAPLFMNAAKSLTPLLLPMLKFVGIGAAIYLVIEDLVHAFGGFGDSVTETLLDSAMEFMGFDYTFQEFKEDIMSGLREIGDVHEWVWGFIKEQWGEGQGWLATTTRGFAKLIVTILATPFNMIKTIASVYKGLATGDWSSFKNSLLNPLKTGLEGIQEMYEGPLEQSKPFLFDLAGTVTRGLGKLFGKDVSLNIVDGSHASGLDYVPFDGYKAELHKGERILTAEENQRFDPRWLDTGFEMFSTTNNTQNETYNEENNEYYTPESDYYVNSTKNINITNIIDLMVEANRDEDTEGMREYIDSWIKQNLPPAIEEFFRMKMKLRPLVTER